MTAKHASPTWRRTVRIVRQQVRLSWERGEPVYCWRTGQEIREGEPYDVGHLNPWGGEDIDNAAPEKRKVNRSEGGRRGAAITNAKKNKTATTKGVVTEMEVPKWTASADRGLLGPAGAPPAFGSIRTPLPSESRR